MTPQDRLHKALQKIVQARLSVVRTAAKWQAEGIETSPLTEPLIGIQEAISQLEQVAASLPAPNPASFIGPARSPANSPNT